MSMLFEEIMVTYYSDDFKLGLFSMADNGDGVFISSWDVPNVPQPTHEEVMALDTPELEFQFALNNFFTQFSPFIQNFIDSVAILRGYGSSLYCLSYINSSTPLWLHDAQTFNEWRDAVWTYIEQQKVLIQNGTRPIPTNLSELTSELPIIVWPS